MNVYIGQCPYCDVRLFVGIEDYYDIEVDDSGLITLTYLVQCWKCEKISESIIASNIEEQVMENNKLDNVEDIQSCIPYVQAKKFDSDLTSYIKIKKDE
jgi:hypothetical protein